VPNPLPFILITDLGKQPMGNQAKADLIIRHTHPASG
jgi:hypothetical protein